MKYSAMHLGWQDHPQRGNHRRLFPESKTSRLTIMSHKDGFILESVVFIATIGTYKFARWQEMGRVTVNVTPNVLQYKYIFQPVIEKYT